MPTICPSSVSSCSQEPAKPPPSLHPIYPDKHVYNLSCLLLKFLVFRISFLYLCFFILSLLCLFTLIAYISFHRLLLSRPSEILPTRLLPPDCVMGSDGCSVISWYSTSALSFPRISMLGVSWEVKK